MLISIKLEIAKQLSKETNLFKDLPAGMLRKLSEEARPMDKIESFPINLVALGILWAKKFRVKSSGIVHKSVTEKVDRYIEMAESPDQVVIKDLDQLYAALTNYVTGLKTKWIWRLSNDGYFLPYLIKGVQDVKARPKSPRHIVLNLVNGYISDGEGKTDINSLSWYLPDLEEQSLDDVASSFESAGYFEVDESELQNVDQDELKNRQKRKRPAKTLNLRQLLANKRYYYNTPALQSDYVEQYEMWQRIQLTEVGIQYTAESKGFSVNASSYYGGSSLVALVDDDGRPCKLVVDEMAKSETGGFNITYDTITYGYQFLPYHLYVRLYDITKHRDVKVHVRGLNKYKYNPELLKDLIVDDELKILLTSLIDGEAQMQGKDLIEGKSGGLIILTFGPPGNGKSLTGEIYSEYAQKPLYQIQASELGMSVDTIEKKLTSILSRAQRWDCILMVDEADAYIHKRGNDMEQNAIVATLLRRLEYFNGIMFMATNRMDIIDDAIISRVTVAIPYENPSPENLILIWKTHYKNFGVNLTEDNIIDIAHTFPMSGRDVRNCLKLLSKYYKNNEEITVESINFIKQYLPSIKE